MSDKTSPEVERLERDLAEAVRMNAALSSQCLGLMESPIVKAAKADADEQRVRAELAEEIVYAYRYHGEEYVKRYLAEELSDITERCAEARHDCRAYHRWAAAHRREADRA